MMEIEVPFFPARPVRPLRPGRRTVWTLVFLVAAACLLDVLQSSAPGIEAQRVRFECMRAGGFVGYFIGSLVLRPLLSDIGGENKEVDLCLSLEKGGFTASVTDYFYPGEAGFCTACRVQSARFFGLSLDFPVFIRNSLFIPAGLCYTENRPPQAVYRFAEARSTARSLLRWARRRAGGMRVSS